MNKVTKFLFILAVIFSLSLNALLLYDKKENMDKNEQEEISDVDPNKNKKVELTKDQISNMFKEYLIESELLDSDNLAIFEIEKITKVGNFISDNNKKLYYIDEKYSCLEGTDCVKTTTEIKTDAEYYNTTTLVVAITAVDETTAIFEILDYSIEQNDDFKKIKPVEVK